ncbi:MAG TPA: glycosyltransferase [Thermomicrobiales bacterium]|nr:glycosyltransferase [Thermomicrobiales bacterium]
MNRDDRLTPRVSVFTPTHEIGAGIDRAWNSLLAQTLTDWEWVVVDDSRSPATANHVATLADSVEARGRVRLVRQYPPLGSVGASKAAATALCRAAILVELDHDDELIPDALELVVRAFAAQPDIVMVSSDWVDRIQDPTGLTTSPAMFGPGWGMGLGLYASEMLGGQRVPVALTPPVTWETIRHIVSVPNHLRAWRADAYRALGGHDWRLPVADDYDLIVRTFLAGAVAHIPRPLYVQHHTGATGNTSRRRNAEIQGLVAEIAGAASHQLNERCLDLGLTPAAALPWAATPIATATVRIDPIADGLAAGGTPLVSVVIPTYDRPGPLRRAIASALAQTWPAIDIVVVGDACPALDQVMATIDDPRVRHTNLATRSNDMGATPRNVALGGIARGSLIAYLDDDNEWTPDHIASLAEPLAADPGLAWRFASFTMGDQPIIARRPRQYQIDTSAIVHRRWLTDRYGGWRAPADVAASAHDWNLVSRWQDEPWLATGQLTVRYHMMTSSQSEAVVAWAAAVANEERLRAAGEPVDTAWRDASDATRVPDVPETRPDALRIAVYAISRNEEAVVSRWAESTRDADLTLLVDTGSRDETVDRARSAGVTVREIQLDPFRFDVARNHAMDSLPEDIDVCICLDIDEVLEPGWRVAVEEGWRQGATRLRCPLEWQWHPTYPSLRYTTNERIHARHGYRWHHPVHEDLLPDDPDADCEITIPVGIRHLRDSVGSRPSYLPLLRIRAAEHPDDGRAAHLLASELRNSGLIDEAKAEIRQALGLTLTPNERLSALLMLAALEPAHRHTILLAAAAEFPDRREAWCELAQLHADAGEWRACRGCCDTALRITERPDDYLGNLFAWSHWPEHLAASASLHLGDPSRAIHHARRALACSPWHAESATLLARARELARTNQSASRLGLAC